MHAHREIDVLYSDHHQYLVGWLRRRIGCIEHAQDLAQDTFVRLMSGRAQPAGQPLRQPRAWLTTIAHGLLVDHVRRQDVERAYLDALAVVPEAQVMSPEERLQILQALVQVDALLDGLPSRARTAFLMSRLDGLTYADIALQMQLSLSAIEKYMATALRHLVLRLAA
ncbi:sigma-70 family RNA polymerase sigma factor [Duganella sp. FT135W]|uniref:Sigma-70 family RNA polymerase sigma factor n=1 Tax=Duganella flavida TaxID=2692175 RepID=A0A6L8KGF5_9BURK|nr:sigma-70 family RNA polymerase sigma factor [Duganella flavida]MYM24924.1 sigma-70 family RNA polymerase sigma factor [Duganella flavida]